jgi:hypothetical protein
VIGEKKTEVKWVQDWIPGQKLSALQGNCAIVHITFLHNTSLKPTQVASNWID